MSGDPSASQSSDLSSLPPACHTRHHPVSLLAPVADPEGLLRQPVSTCPVSSQQVPDPVGDADQASCEAQSSCLLQDWDNIVNPSNPLGLPVLLAYWPPVSPVTLPTPLVLPVSVQLDQLSQDSDFAPAPVPTDHQQPLQSSVPRCSIPGSFDPRVSFSFFSEPTVVPDTNMSAGK